ncbi:MAG: phage tail protein, partial [Pyrinomonadaceae bacterium]
MDVNGTKFHLLLGFDDWSRCNSADGKSLREIWQNEIEGETSAEQTFDWNDERNAITLHRNIFQFEASPKDRPPDLSTRRGAARDRYGNWFWIDETGTKIKVLSVGSKTVSDFYPAAENFCENENAGDFQPLETGASDSAISFRGVAVTIDHYLIVGSVEPAGLLIFDLFSVGEPRRILWREETPFAPFDIAARFGGGAFVLDRENKRFWTFDRAFNLEGEKDFDLNGTAELFQPVDESKTERTAFQTPDLKKLYSELPRVKDPISIEALPDDTVLILYKPEKTDDFSVLERYWRTTLIGKLSTASIRTYVKEKVNAKPPKKFRLRGYDIAFVKGSDADETRDRLYIASEEGNQTFAFTLICKGELPDSISGGLPGNVVKRNFELQPVPEYFPMRLYGGKSLAAAADGKVYYDLGEKFLPLVKQNRPRYITDAALLSPVFDGKEAGCVWHRIIFDGCLPPETKVEIFSRTAAEKDEIESAIWRKEPAPYLRADGSDIPFARQPVSKENGQGAWEFLLQNAKNRYLQLQLVFSGNAQKTPHISALRAYYPRFSYLQNYLPAIYRDDEQSASFLDRFLSNFEGVYTTIEDRIAAAQMLFDVRSAPPDALEWLADWFGIALDPGWDENKRRLFIKRAIDFYQFRGTMRGLRAALRLTIYPCADESFFDAQTASEKKLDPIRIVERFQTRITPEIIPSDFITKKNKPRLVEQTEKWKPYQGADVLNRLYGRKFFGSKFVEFPFIKPADASTAKIWESFSLFVLGFMPSSAAALERRQWQGFLSAEYRNIITSLNASHRKHYRDFEDISLPTGAETNLNLIADWRKYIAETSAMSSNRKFWQDFLARRYRRIGQLNKIYGTNWDSFDSVSLFDRLPWANQPLADWYLFESVVLAMRRTAHRFTVLIPAIVGGRKAETLEAQKSRLELVRRIIELEKPAHTVFDFRYYWNLFRLNEVRLGADSLLGLGSRDPQL